MKLTPLRVLTALTMITGMFFVSAADAAAASRGAKQKKLKGLGDNEPAWYESWRPNKTGVPTPTFNCALYDPTMQPWLGRKRRLYSPDFKPFGCSIWADSDSAPTMYKGWYEGHGNGYW